MSHESAYTKKLTPETKMDKVEGVLEHLNLPPKAITFIRKHNKLIISVILLFFITSVCWSFYNSYRNRIREESSSALSQAMQVDIKNRSEALKKVIEKYGSTSSGQWAKIELAHLAMKNGDFKDAAERYALLLSSQAKDNPSYPLLLFALAQALESAKKYDEASEKYNILKDIPGYGYIAYISLARVEEDRGNIDKAITVYNNFILSAGDDPSFSQARDEIKARIARLSAQK